MKSKAENKTSNAQRRATKKWEQNNPEAKRYLRVRSNARTFARKYAKSLEEVEELVEIFKNENIKGEKIMKNLAKLKQLSYSIANKDDLEESIQGFKELLKGIDLNEVVTELSHEDNDSEFFFGDITKNWFELVRGNWNGSKYAAEVKDDYIQSMTIYELLTTENSEDIFNIIEEISSGFKVEPKESMILSLNEIVDKKGYLTAKVLDDRYLITNDDEYEILKWLDDHEEDPEAEFKFKTRDILKDEDVYFLIKADQRETFVNDGGIGACKIKMVK